MNTTVTIVLGPTGVGKTDYSLQMAEAMGSPVINCDSRQIYKEMRIGTARPSEEQMRRVRHYFVGTHSIFDAYAAGIYELEAWNLVEKLAPVHSNLLMVGGSCMYIDAFCRGMDDFPDPDPDLRAQLNATLASPGGLESLRLQLKILDPGSYAKMDLSNGQRILRAVEVSLQTGKPFSSFHTGVVKRRPCPIRKIGLIRPKDEVYDRINLRVLQMMEAGLLDEARALYPYRNLVALQTVGYKELFAYLDGRVSLEEAVRLIQRNTRRYAKKQMSWWQRDASIEWVKLT